MDDKKGRSLRNIRTHAIKRRVRREVESFLNNAAGNLNLRVWLIRVTTQIKVVAPTNTRVTTPGYSPRLGPAVVRALYEVLIGFS